MIAGMPRDDPDESADSTVQYIPWPDVGLRFAEDELFEMLIEFRIVPRLQDNRPSRKHRSEPHHRITTVQQMARPPPQSGPVYSGVGDWEQLKITNARGDK